MESGSYMAIIARSGCQCTGNYRNIPVIPRNQPYAIVLDESASVLHPAAGEKQRFCYHVSFNPSEPNAFVPLEYVIIGIAGSITEAEINLLTVCINGVSQAVSWGVNAFLVTGDARTGCRGLRLNFPLKNATDVMKICLGFQHIFTTGNVDVCFFGTNQASASVVSGPVAAEQAEDCPTTSYQEVDVCVPVTIAPYANVGEATVTCCGAPTITEGTASCAGTAGGTCSFTVSQRVCVAVPVTFGANTSAGDYRVNCGTPGEGDCQNCTAASALAASLPRAGSGCHCNAAYGNTRIQDVIGWETKDKNW